ncbi:hypothetical protein ACP275_14G045700 [Erythranthe tilingii]
MKTLFSIIVIFLYLVHKTESYSSLRRHHIHIYNQLPSGFSPLLVHSASKDDDLGNHTLYPGQDFSWSFKSNIFSRTLYFCRFTMGPRTVAFDVFNADNEEITYNTYNYVAQADGIYSNVDPDNPFNNLVLVQPWQ